MVAESSGARNPTSGQRIRRQLPASGRTRSLLNRLWKRIRRASTAGIAAPPQLAGGRRLSRHWCRQQNVHSVPGLAGSDCGFAPVFEGESYEHDEEYSVQAAGSACCYDNVRSVGGCARCSRLLYLGSSSNGQAEMPKHMSCTLPRLSSPEPIAIVRVSGCLPGLYPLRMYGFEDRDNRRTRLRRVGDGLMGAAWIDSRSATGWWSLSSHSSRWGRLLSS